MEVDGDQNPLRKRIKLDDIAEASRGAEADPPFHPAKDGEPGATETARPREETADAARPNDGENAIEPKHEDFQGKDTQEVVAPHQNGGQPASTTAAPSTQTTTMVLAQADTYCSRELRHIERERSAELRALYIYNDGSPDSGRYLAGLKNVFAKCLPNMPKTYITRLVFDRRHRSVLIVRNGSKVIAGITYRPFLERRFGEIAFCAVAQTLQVSGIGTRLMNWTKHYARERDACEYFLTYADNAAVGYFLKQGFTKSIAMPKERWHGFIKDYDGTTMMECYIHPTLPHTALPEMIAAQRKALDSEVRQYTSAHVVHPGLCLWKEGGGPLEVRDIPGVIDAGWDEAAAAEATPRFHVVLDGQVLPPTQETLNAVMTRLLDLLVEQKELIWPFLEPVDPAAVPDYYEIIKNPMDVSTIRQRLERGTFYTNLDIFTADVTRMFANAKIYNDAETPYYKHAHRLLVMYQSWLTAAVQYDASTGQ